LSYEEEVRRQLAAADFPGIAESIHKQIPQPVMMWSTPFAIRLHRVNPFPIVAAQAESMAGAELLLSLSLFIE
jgi:hypothetical protein